MSREVRNAFYSPVSLDAVPAPELIVLSETAAARTGIPPEVIEVIEVIRASRRIENKNGHGDANPEGYLQQVALVLSGAQLDLLRGAEPYSSSYGGHQFGNWAGQLGDGRVATIGEISIASRESETARIAGGEDGSLMEVS